MECPSFPGLFRGGRRLGVDFDQLQHAIAAADYGSFRQAAEVLSIKQSTLSRSIQLLEHRFGAAIFERSSGGVRATPTGRQFLRMARSILEQLDTLASMTRATGRGEAGRLAIGFCTSLTTGNLRASLLDFRQRFPQIELATVERRRTRLATALRNGVLDVLIIVGNLPSPSSNAKPLWNERVFAVLPAEHSLAAREAVYWTDLRDETIILSQYDPGQEIEDLLVSKLVSPVERPKIERHDVSRGVVKSLVTMKAGISLVLESDIGANFSGLVYREIRDGTGPSMLSYAAYWQNDNENPALETFLKLLSERYPSRHLAT
ncbi:LysR family transcriptional regulator [Bradyrhizobium liaoningense]|nr:LysR family transcriptional regulator [Bradyrhizobium liaoningense]